MTNGLKVPGAGSAMFPVGTLRPSGQRKSGQRKSGQYTADQMRAAIAAAVKQERERLIPEREAIGELLCSVADNLGDMPISEAWADAVSKRASDILIRNDYFRDAAIRKGE